MLPVGSLSGFCLCFLADDYTTRNTIFRILAAHGCAEKDSMRPWTLHAMDHLLEDHLLIGSVNSYSNGASAL